MELLANGNVRMSEEEMELIEEGFAQIDRGEFVTLDEAIASSQEKAKAWLIANKIPKSA